MVDKFMQKNPVTTIVIAIVIIAILMILFAVKRYYDTKAAKLEADNLLGIKNYEWTVGIDNPANKRLDPVYLRVEATNRFLDLIDAMVINEVADIIFTFQMLNKEYPLQQLDSDIERGTLNVLNGISKENLLDRNLVITPEYITQSTTRTMRQELILKVQEYNAKRRLTQMTQE